MRLVKLKPEEMTPRQLELAQRIAGRRGQVRGPFLCWLHSPELCDRVEALGAFVRFNCSLSEKLREFSILICSRHWDAQHSWNAHLDKAIAAGLGADTAQAIAERREPPFHHEDEQVFYRFATEILEKHFVSDQTYADAIRLFGSHGVVDAIGCLGNFSMLAMCLNTFQVDLDPSKPPPFADVRGYAEPISAKALA